MEVFPDIFLVKLPLPFKANHINCYLLRGKSGWSIIDTGINYSPSTTLWEEIFTDLDIKYGDIEGIYVSHMHPGHYGASGWLQELTGAPVFMNREEIAGADKTWKKGRTNISVVGDLFKENGMPHDFVSEVLDNMSGMLNFIHPHPCLSPLPVGEKVEIGGRRFEVISTPGHSEGHVIFFNQEEGILISGDYLLAAGFSGIRLWPTSHPNPLELFLSSLENIWRLPVKLAFPGHGPVITDCSGRARELLEYHQEKLVRIADLAGSGSTAYQICIRLSGSEPALSEITCTLTETLAYLAYLQSRLKVVSRLEAGVVTYKKVSEAAGI